MDHRVPTHTQGVTKDSPGTACQPGAVSQLGSSGHWHEPIVMERPRPAPRLWPEAAHWNSPQLCKGQRKAQHLPEASSYICLAEALGLRFKSLFIDSYKGESELLTCLHSTKSIHIKRITAELPLPTHSPASQGQ